MNTDIFKNDEIEDDYSEHTENSEISREKAVGDRIIKIQSGIRMLLAMKQYQNMRFLYLITGKKTFPEVWLHQMPESNAPQVLRRQRQLGPLRLNADQKFQVNENISGKYSKPAIKIGITQKKGQLYTGQWNSTKKTKEGYGVMILADGSKYEGFWKDNASHGYGRFLHFNGEVYIGKWKNDMAHGKGEYYYNSGAHYSGDWVEHQQHGYGREEWPNRDLYEGNYQNGLKEGEGTFKWADGARYQGTWSKNQMHGEGIFYETDGRVYQGNYFAGKKHGYGIYSWPDGRKYEGGF